MPEWLKSTIMIAACILLSVIFLGIVTDQINYKPKRWMKSTGYNELTQN